MISAHQNADALHMIDMLVRHRHGRDPGDIRADGRKRAFDRLSRQSCVHQQGGRAAGYIGTVAGGSGKQGTENHRACPFLLIFQSNNPKLIIPLFFGHHNPPLCKKHGSRMN